MSGSAATVSCVIEVYPFEGGQYTIQGGAIHSMTINKPLRNAAGSFSVELAPGGPLGVEDPNTWSKIITPMSHIIIGMARGAVQNVVFDGVVTNIGESQQWSADLRSSSASRGQAFGGQDFNYFFRAFNFYALTFYGLTAGTGLGGVLNYLPQDLITVIGQGRIGGNNSKDNNPVEIGRLWYTKIMIGQNGILNKTYLPYKPIGAKIPFSAAIASIWENYPNVFIPTSDSYMAVMETWMEKLVSMLTPPWYEVFVTTAPADAYPLPKGSQGIEDKGTQFSMSSLPTALPAGPKLVIRINPFPSFNVTPPGSDGTVKPDKVDVTRWNALPITDLSKFPYRFTSSTIQFGADAAYNFYQINPTSMSGQIGTNNANNIPTLFQFIAACDPASIQRYGFKPYIGSTRWMFDPTGSVAQNKDLNIQNTILQLTAAYIGYVHPEPLMAHGEVVIPLNPGILVGTRFRYAPFKSTETWDFYIEGYRHHYVFGGQSSTMISLARGLPTTVYNDSGDDGLLKAVLTGNAMRKDGVYVKGLPPGSAPGLTFVVTSEQANSLSQSLAHAVVTPQVQGTN